MDPPASAMLLARSKDLQNDWRLQMCKCINILTYIILFYRCLPTASLTTRSFRLCGFCSGPRFFSLHMVHVVVVCDRPVLPWKLSKISRPSRQAFHSHCGRAKGASSSMKEYRPVSQSCGCWGVRTAVGDNDPGSVRRGSGLAWFRS
jgi:hypothetical protein